MTKLLAAILIAALLAPFSLWAKEPTKHHSTAAQGPQLQAANPNCAFGVTPPGGTSCSIGDYTVGGALSLTDAISICQVAGGCFASSPTITYKQVPLVSSVRGILSATAPLTYSAATGAFGCPTFGTSAGGCVPTSPGGTTLYLRADGSFAAPNVGITGPGPVQNLYVPQWSGTTGTALGAGLPVGLTGNSTIVETSSGGLIANSLISGLPNASLANPSLTLNTHVVALGGTLSLVYSDLGAFATTNTIPKGNGTALAASSLTDNGTTVSTTEAAAVGSLQVTNQAGTGVRCIHADASGNQSAASGDCATGGSGSVTSVAAGTGLTASPSPITTSGTISLANMATGLLGNPTGTSAAPSTITLGTGLSFSGSVLNATATGGGNVSTSGTITTGTLGVWATGTTLAGTLAYSTTAAANTIAEMNASGTLASGMIPAINLAAGGAGGVTGALPATSLSGTLNAAQMPAYSGNVTSPAGSTVNTIANNAVTYGMMVNETASTLLGNPNPTSGVTTPITLSSNFGFSAGALTLSGTIPAAQMPAYTGDVTSAAGLVVNTIPNGTVTNAKAATMFTNTVKANLTPATAAPADVPTTGTANATSVVTSTSAAKTSGHLATWDANANLADGGAVPAGGVSVTASTPNIVVNPSGTLTNSLTIATTAATNPQSGASYTVNCTAGTGDATKTILMTSGSATTVSVPAATGACGSGFGFDVTTYGAGSTLTAPTGTTINGIAGPTGIKMGPRQTTSWFSDGANWQVAYAVSQAPTQTGTSYYRDDGVFSATINATTLGGATFAAPGPIGGTTPGTGSFSSLTDTGITGSTQCVQASSTGVLSGTGSACGAGGGGVTSVTGTAGQVTATGTTAVTVGLPTTITQGTTFSANLGSTCTLLTNASTIAANAGNGDCGTMTMSLANSPYTLAFPTGLQSGQWYTWYLTQPPSGAGAVISTYGSGSNFIFIGGIPVLNPANNAVNSISCQGVSATVLNCVGGVGTTQLMAATTNAQQPFGMLGEEIKAYTPTGTGSGLTVTGGGATVLVTWTGHAYNCNVSASQAAAGEQCAMPIVFNSNVPSGITTGTVYWVIGSTISGNSFNIASSEANALAGTALTASGTTSTTATATAGVPITNNTAADIAAVQVAPGAWSIGGNVGLVPVSTATIFTGWAGIISNTQPTPLGSGSMFQEAASFPSAANQVRPTGQSIFRTSAATPVYLGCQVTFTSTAACFGSLRVARPY